MIWIIFGVLWLAQAICFVRIAQGTKLGRVLLGEVEEGHLLWIAFLWPGMLIVIFFMGLIIGGFWSVTWLFRKACGLPPIDWS